MASSRRSFTRLSSSTARIFNFFIKIQIKGDDQAGIFFQPGVNLIAGLQVGIGVQIPGKPLQYFFPLLKRRFHRDQPNPFFH